MKIFEQRQEDGSRKLMGTLTTIADATEVVLKTKDGTESTFDFTKQYHYVAPGSFAKNGTTDALGMYIEETRVVPPANIEFEDEDSDADTEPKKYTEEELNAMTKQEIADLATSLGYEGVTTTLNKEQMIEAFLAEQNK